MNYPTCGEISCEECNDRYEKAMARIAELEAMVRESIDLMNDSRIVYPSSPFKSTVIRYIEQALALLQPDEGKEETNGQR